MSTKLHRKYVVVLPRNASQGVGLGGAKLGHFVCRDTSENGQNRLFLFDTKQELDAWMKEYTHRHTDFKAGMVVWEEEDQ